MTENEQLEQFDDKNEIDEEKLKPSNEMIDDQFFRHEIDRGIYKLACEFSTIAGQQFIETAYKLLEKNKDITILDVGCGTGKSLVELKEQLLYQVEIFHPKERENFEIKAIGINDKDYSQEGSYYKTRNAIKKGIIDYIVSKIETVKFSSASFNFIYSYETLIHNKNVISVIEKLLTLLKPDGGGTLFQYFRKTNEG